MNPGCTRSMSAAGTQCQTRCPGTEPSTCKPAGRTEDLTDPRTFPAARSTGGTKPAKRLWRTPASLLATGSSGGVCTCHHASGGCMSTYRVRVMDDQGNTCSTRVHGEFRTTPREHTTTAYRSCSGHNEPAVPARRQGSPELKSGVHTDWRDAERTGQGACRSRQPG